MSPFIDDLRRKKDQQMERFGTFKGYCVQKVSDFKNSTGQNYLEWKTYVLEKSSAYKTNFDQKYAGMKTTMGQKLIEWDWKDFKMMKGIENGSDATVVQKKNDK